MAFFSIKKYISCIALFLFFCPVFFLSAEDIGGTANAGAGSSKVAATSASVPIGTDETGIYLDSAAGPVAPSKAKTGPSSLLILLQVVCALAIVCAGIYGVVYLMKKTTQANASNDPFLKSVATLTLSPNKTVQVLSIGSTAYLVGVTDQAISLIAEVKDAELIDAMNLESARKAAQPPASFASVLGALLPEKLRTPAKKEKDNDSVSGLGTADFIRRQRERLSGSAARGEAPANPENENGNAE